MCGLLKISDLATLVSVDSNPHNTRVHLLERGTPGSMVSICDALAAKMSVAGIENARDDSQQALEVSLRAAV